jgi:hypothetical protein
MFRFPDERRKTNPSGAATVIARLEEQESKIQKVSAQLEVHRPAPQTVVNNQ